MIPFSKEEHKQNFHPINKFCIWTLAPNAGKNTVAVVLEGAWVVLVLLP